MDTEDLLLLHELCEDDYIRPSTSPNYFSIESELFETKNYVKILEEKMNLLEERIKTLEGKNDTTNLSLSMFPLRNPIRNGELYFCDVNCTEIKIDSKLYIFMDECLFCDIWDFRLLEYNESSPSFRFLQQFKGIKTFIIDLSYTIIGGDKPHQSNSRSTEMLLNVCKIILNSNNDTEIVFKSNNLYEFGNRIERLFKEIFMNLHVQRCKKLNVEITNNLIISNNSFASYQTQPYVNDTKSYCIKNKIEFHSNIGL